MQPVIQVKDVSKYYGEVLAVDAINFTVGQGAICALLGGNGAGKTTTLSMNLRPEAAPTFPRQPIPSLPYLLGGCSRRRSTSSIHGVVHPCSRLPLGEGGPKGQVRGETARSWLQFVATARPGGLSMLLDLLLPPRAK